MAVWAQTGYPSTSVVYIPRSPLKGYQSAGMLLNRCPSLLYTARRGLHIRHKSSKPAAQLDLADLPLRLAVIGSGPAGFYAASRILGLKGSRNVQIDMYEELPVPFGLVRYGVAPDHPEVKVGSHCASVCHHTYCMH